MQINYQSNLYAPIPSIKPSIEILSTSDEKDIKKINFAREVVYFAFSNNFESISDIADYIGKRFCENYNENWNCTVWEWNKGGSRIFSFKKIDIKYNNYKIII